MNLKTATPNRRIFLQSMVAGSALFPAIVGELLADGSSPEASPLAARDPHFAAKAKRIIFIFSNGGVSQMDTFDHKPKLFEADGKKTGVGGGLSNEERVLLKPMWDFKPGGTCGTLVSDLFPNLRERMDDVCLIRSMKSDDNEHYQASLMMHTGSLFFARPSIGSWVSYGLGTINRNLPSFMVIAPQLPYAGAQVFNNDFLPADHQGTRVVPGNEPIRDLAARSERALQEREMALAAKLNRQHLTSRAAGDLSARMNAFETAFRMQTEAPEAFDMRDEPDHVLKLYGLDRGKTDHFGWQCLVARRLAERGVRFIELIDGSSNSNWDQHSNMQDHAKRAQMIDQPIAGLLIDLKNRGLLDETLVVWTTEFGRTPGVDGHNGRGHHSACFCSWLAGGGAKGGIAYGATDEIASKVAENMVHVHDFHATILHAMGLDHTRLTFRHGGRDYRLTDVHGNVVSELLA